MRLMLIVALIWSVGGSPGVSGEAGSCVDTDVNISEAYSLLQSPKLQSKLSSSRVSFTVDSQREESGDEVGTLVMPNTGALHCPWGYWNNSAGKCPGGGTCCEAGWHRSCGQECRKAKCEEMGGTWIWVDTSVDPYTCEIPLTVPQDSCPPGFSECTSDTCPSCCPGDGKCCQKDWTRRCGIDCAMHDCWNYGGNWVNVNFDWNPYTCEVSSATKTNCQKEVTDSDAELVATFRATGCPNEEVDLTWWKTQRAATIWDAMYSDCMATKQGTANPHQMSMCCGDGCCSPAACTKQSSWQSVAPTSAPTPAPTPSTPISPIPFPCSSTVLEVDPEFSCAPAAKDTSKSDKCHGRGHYISAKADLGYTLGIQGEDGCLMVKNGYIDHAEVNVSEIARGVMPRTRYVLTQDSSKCQKFWRESVSGDTFKFWGNDALGRTTAQGGVGKLAAVPPTEAEYIATFAATGCPNKNVGLTWWKTQDPLTVWDDMHTYCYLVKAGRSSARQKATCCGDGVNCSPTACRKQSSWQPFNPGDVGCPSGFSVCSNCKCAGTGLCCHAEYTDDCGEGCARAKCQGAGGQWAWLDYSSDPYTCEIPKNNTNRNAPTDVDDGINDYHLTFKLSGNTYQTGELKLQVIGDFTNAEVGMCVRCDFPYRGRFCEDTIQNYTQPIHTLVVVFTTKHQYRELKDKVEQYREDLLTYEKLASDVMVWDMPKLWSLRPYRALRHVIKTEFVYRRLKAVFFIGEFPAAWVHHVGFHAGTRPHPVMFYYGAFTYKQSFADQDCNGELELPGNVVSSVNLDVTVGMLNHGSIREYNTYLDRLHAHRVRGGYPEVQRLQWSFNEGHWWCSPPWIYGTHHFNNDHYCWNGNRNIWGSYMQKNKAVYTEMMNSEERKYEFYNGQAHAWHAGLQLGVGVHHMWNRSFSGMGFFNLFHCSAAKYSAKNLASTMALSTRYGLASVGCSHTGAMLGNKIFEQLLGSGLSWGDAFLRWWNSKGRHNTAWHTGMVIYGDPNVRMRGGRYRASLIQTPLESSPSAEPGDLNETELRRLEELMVEIDEKLEENSEDSQSFEQYAETQNHLDEPII